MRIDGLILWLIALLLPISLSAQEKRPHSILVLDQSDGGPFYYQLLAGVRAVVAAHPDGHVTLYNENLDISRFSGQAFEESLKRYLKEKYQKKTIGAIISVGAATTEMVLSWRGELWPGIPVIFSMLDEVDLARIKKPVDVTGLVTHLPLEDEIKAARVAVPDLDTIVLVGDSWSSLVVYRNWGAEVASAAAGLKIIDLVGAKLRDVRKHVTELPQRSAIIYSAMFSDGEGKSYLPSVALSRIAEVANRPIIVPAETFLSSGGFGGYMMLPRQIGEDTAKLALQVLDGSPVSELPPMRGGVGAIFNWMAMKRWGVSASDLPPGSEVRFRDPGFFERYRWESVLVAAALLVQAALIAFLLHERHMRQRAEVEARQRMTELAHINRQATTGELSTTIAHELNQPLGSILANAEAAELMLRSSNPNLDEIREILVDIKRDDQRAGEVIRRLRGLLKRTPFETREINLNEIMSEAFKFMSVQATARNIALYLQTEPEPLRVRGDPIHLQQVILNLIVNSMDAMDSIPYGRTVIGRTELKGGSAAVVSISDSGPGIPADKLGQVFDPFYTTKEKGMGIGLSIARTIVLAHRGQIWAENQSSGGATFRFRLPLETSGTT